MSDRFPDVSAQLARRYRAEGAWRDVLCDQALVETAARRADELALVDRRGEMTWGELEASARGFAAGLGARGVGRGDVVSWILPNWREAAIAHWGIWLVGGVSNPIVPIYRHREVGYIVAQAQSRAIVIPKSFRGFDYETMLCELANDLPSLETIVTVEEGAGRNAESSVAVSALGDLGVGFEALIETQSIAAETAGRSPDDPALLLYTSGTTADPKGAVHTHNTLDSELRSMVEFYGLGEETVVYMPSPLSHVTGLLYGIQLPALIGGSVVYQDQFEAEAGLDLVAEYGCSFSVGATPFLVGLCDAQSARPRTLALKTFVCGGADVPADLIRSANEVLGCQATRAYGSTEFPTVTGGNAADPIALRAETDGRVMDHCEVRVVDEAGHEVAPGVAGELEARGPELFTGYLGGVGADSLDAEGWFSTGDLVSIERGYLTVEGRIKDIILRGGENISVKEIEELLYGHPDVDEVAIVAMPDLALTERACAFVVSRNNIALELADLVEFLEGHRLARQKFPERLELLEALPKTPSGKVQKNRLRTWIAERQATEAREGGR